MNAARPKYEINPNQIGFIFQNYTGIPMKFCIHDMDLNDALEYPDTIVDPP